MFRPNAGFSAIKLLKSAGCDVDVPKSQTCCGQPGFNSGDRQSAVALAKRVIEAFESYDYVVIPSGSCAGMVTVHYPELFAEDREWLGRANALAAKTHELVQFLADVCDAPIDAEYDGAVMHHDSCSAMRELKIKKQPRTLLGRVQKLTRVETTDDQSCCGFGGTFCVKYPDVSMDMVSRKVAAIDATAANLVVSSDMGCLLNIAGAIRRAGLQIEVRHIAEVLAGETTDEPIGGAAK